MKTIRETSDLDNEIYIPTDNIWLTRITIAIFAMIFYICLFEL